MSAALKTLDGGGLDALTARGAPVLAEFFGPDCMICRRIEPMLRAVAAELDGRLSVVRVDAAAEPALAERLTIRSLPTLILWRDGAIAERRTGFLTAGELRRWVKPMLEA